MGEQYHFDPDTYMAMVTAEVPAYGDLQREVAKATQGLDVHRILDLGAGTGETAVGVLARHPDATLVGIDESEPMLEYARRRLPGADLRMSRLEDPLPSGPFDLVISALAIHHLDGPGKAGLFQRLAVELRPGGRVVVGDVVVPDNPDDVVTPVDGVYDMPSTVDDQLGWIRAAGLNPRVAWRHRDLAVFVADSPPTT